MTIRAWAIGVGAAFLLSACSGSSDTGTTSGTSAGTGTSSGSSTGRHTNGGFPTNVTGSSTGSSSAGASSTGTGTSSSSGSGTGGSSTGGSTTGTSGGTTTGTTGYVPAPPYQGYDSGVQNQPSIDQGCAACGAAFRGPFGYYCVTVASSTPIVPPAWKCDATNQCVACSSLEPIAIPPVRSATRAASTPIPLPTISAPAVARSIAAPPMRASAHRARATAMPAVACLAAAIKNSDCQVNGLGACDFSQAPLYGWAARAPRAARTPGVVVPTRCACFTIKIPMATSASSSCLVDAGVCGNWDLLLRWWELHRWLSELQRLHREQLGLDLPSGSVRRLPDRGDLPRLQFRLQSAILRWPGQLWLLHQRSGLLWRGWSAALRDQQERQLLRQPVRLSRGQRLPLGCADVRRPGCHARIPGGFGPLRLHRLEPVPQQPGRAVHLRGSLPLHRLQRQLWAGSRRCVHRTVQRRPERHRSRGHRLCQRGDRRGRTRTKGIPYATTPPPLAAGLQQRRRAIASLAHLPADCCSASSDGAGGYAYLRGLSQWHRSQLG